MTYDASLASLTQHVADNSCVCGRVAKPRRVAEAMLTAGLHNRGLKDHPVTPEFPPTQAVDAHCAASCLATFSECAESSIREFHLPLR